MLKLHFLYTSTRYIFDLGKKCMLMQYYVAAARLGKCSIDSLIEASSLELYMYVLHNIFFINSSVYIFELLKNYVISMCEKGKAYMILVYCTHS